VRRHFGAAGLEFVRGKLDIDPRRGRLRGELVASIEAEPAPYTAARAATRFDLDSLVPSLVAYLICGTTDIFQGLLVRDPAGVVASGRWTYVDWDLDQSFHQTHTFHRFANFGDVLPYLKHRGVLERRPAAALMRRLLAEDPAFRIRVAAAVTAALNHELSAKEVERLIARYRRIAAELEIPDRSFLDQLEQVLADRPATLYVQLEKYLDVGPPQPVEVAAPAGSVRVDGRAVDAIYRGRYPKGLHVVVEVDPVWRSRFTGWRVDGRLEGGGPRLELPVDHALEIEPRFTGSPEAAIR
jgi:CotH kinase protein